MDPHKFKYNCSVVKCGWGSEAGWEMCAACMKERTEEYNCLIVSLCAIVSELSLFYVDSLLRIFLFQIFWSLPSPTQSTMLSSSIVIGYTERERGALHTLA